jgi:fibronectin type 3 domain-containing protein
VYRHDVVSNHEAIAGELPVEGEPNPTLLDTSFEWEKTYDYRLSVVTLVEQASGVEQVEGDDTPPVRVVTHDIFPPSTPAGLQAVFSGPGQTPFIDLVWASNGEADLAGYNVYRGESGSEAVKINTELVKTPAFRDSNVISGHQYFYSVSAVDVRSNESPRSEEASETVP